jgi:hypothetical protein
MLSKVMNPTPEPAKKEEADKTEKKAQSKSSLLEISTRMATFQ